MVTRPAKVTPVLPPEATKIKLCLVGDSQVGKTQFCKGFQDNFSATYEPTIGSDYYMKNVKLGKNSYQFNVWDLSGDVNYIEVRNEFYKESQALIIMFDITKKASFDALDMWLREASKNGGENLPVFVVGNKVDLADANSQEHRAVMKSEALKLASEHDISYFETSAKENLNITELMQHIMSKVYDNLYQKSQ